MKRRLFLAMLMPPVGIGAHLKELSKKVGPPHILAIERGIISTNATDLRKLYEVYDEDFEASHQYRSIVKDTFDFIVEHFGELRNTHMMKPYALHSLFTALVHARFGIDRIESEFGIRSINCFAENINIAKQQLLEMAQAHEAREEDGRYAEYVWGCMSTTDRKTRRTSRVLSILNALT